MVILNHHYFAFLNRIRDVLSSVPQQILEAPQQTLEAPQHILEYPKFRKDPVFQTIEPLFVKKNTLKFWSDGLNKPSPPTITLQLAVSQHIKSKSDGLWFIFTF